MTTPTRPQTETARLGKEIYEREIRSQAEADHHGEVVAVDVNSGGYAIGENVIAAVGRLREQRPGADIPGADVWLTRVGHRALYRFGGGSLRGVR